MTTPPVTSVHLDTVRLYYEESNAARQQVEGLLEKYRANASTLLALASAAVAFFGFSSGPRQAACYWISIVAYLSAVALAFSIYVPLPWRVNVAYNTLKGLKATPILPEKAYLDYAQGHQEAINHALKVLDGKFGVANRFRTLIVAIAVLIVAASLSVNLGNPATREPTRVIVERSTP